MIVEDINNKDVAGPDMNVDALATKSAEYVSTLNAGQGVNKVTTQEELCSYCGNTGPAAIDCRKRLREEERRKAKNKTNGSSGSGKPNQGPQRGPPEWHKTAECHECGEVGHMKTFCPNKNKTDAKTGSEDLPVYQLHRQGLKNSSLVWRGGTSMEPIQPQCVGLPWHC